MDIDEDMDKGTDGWGGDGPDLPGGSVRRERDESTRRWTGGQNMLTNNPQTELNAGMSEDDALAAAIAASTAGGVHTAGSGFGASTSSGFPPAANDPYMSSYNNTGYAGQGQETTRGRRSPTPGPPEVGQRKNGNMPEIGSGPSAFQNYVDELDPRQAAESLLRMSQGGGGKNVRFAESGSGYGGNLVKVEDHVEDKDGMKGMVLAGKAQGEEEFIEDVQRGRGVSLDSIYVFDTGRQHGLRTRLNGVE